MRPAVATSSHPGRARPAGSAARPGRAWPARPRRWRRPAPGPDVSAGQGGAAAPAVTEGAGVPLDGAGGVVDFGAGGADEGVGGGGVVGPGPTTAGVTV